MLGLLAPVVSPSASFMLSALCQDPEAISAFFVFASSPGMERCLSVRAMIDTNYLTVRAAVARSKLEAIGRTAWGRAVSLATLGRGVILFYYSYRMITRVSINLSAAVSL